jgi:hypothetical protein
MSVNTTVVATTSQVSCVVGGEVLLLGIEHGQYYGLRGTGALLWDLIQSPRQVGELCAAVRARYDVGEAQCAADVQAFLSDLLSHGLATVVEA